MAAARTVHQAAEEGQEEELSRLLHRQLEIVNEEDEYGETPLHLACMAGHESCVKLLLINGAEARSPFLSCLNLRSSVFFNLARCCLEFFLLLLFGPSHCILPH